jgi:hypothetical protein
VRREKLTGSTDSRGRFYGIRFSGVSQPFTLRIANGLPEVIDRNGFLATMQDDRPLGRIVIEGVTSEITVELAETMQEALFLASTPATEKQVYENGKWTNDVLITDAIAGQLIKTLYRPEGAVGLMVAAHNSHVTRDLALKVVERLSTGEQIGGGIFAGSGYNQNSASYGQAWHPVVTFGGPRQTAWVDIASRKTDDTIHSSLAPPPPRLDIWGVQAGAAAGGIPAGYVNLSWRFW